MRIFYASDNTPNAGLNSNLWRNNLYSSLVDLGYDVIEFDYDLGKTFRNIDTNDPIQRKFIEANRPKLSGILLDQIKKNHSRKPIDIFFSYFYDVCVLPETIDEIKKLGIKTVNWYCNGSYQLDLVSEISPHYDACLVPEKFRLEDYKKMGANPIYCQEAANPKIYHPYDVSQKHDVSFVGMAYGERPNIIKSLLEAQINVRVWGRGWENFSDTSRVEKLAKKVLRRLRQLNFKFTDIRKGLSTDSKNPVTIPKSTLGGTLSDTQMVKKFSESKINLGFSSVGNTGLEGQRIVQVRLRDFEIPMSGGFYLVEHMEELEEFFKFGSEIETYKTSSELIDKIKFYLTHDEAREKIRKAGHARALRDHSWQKRLSDSFQALGWVKK